MSLSESGPGAAVAAGVTLVRPKRFEDARGWFMETYSRRRLAELGIDCAFVQDNHSLSRTAGTVRGLHLQRPPHAQAKLVRCLRGRILDVVVDLRRDSPTWAAHVAVELTPAGEQLFVPIGFGHGFMTLEPDTEVAYKTSAAYHPDSEDGVLWNDPALGVDWPAPADGVVVSERDMTLPELARFESPFAYDGRPLALTVCEPD